MRSNIRAATQIEWDPLLKSEKEQHLQRQIHFVFLRWQCKCLCFVIRKSVRVYEWECVCVFSTKRVRPHRKSRGYSLPTVRCFKYLCWNAPTFAKYNQVHLAFCCQILSQRSNSIFIHSNYPSLSRPSLSLPLLLSFTESRIRSFVFQSKRLQILIEKNTNIVRSWRLLQFNCYWCYGSRCCFYLLLLLLLPVFVVSLHALCECVPEKNFIFVFLIFPSRHFIDHIFSLHLLSLHYPSPVTFTLNMKTQQQETFSFISIPLPDLSFWILVFTLGKRTASSV